MRRSPATIVILAWNAWESTQACLDSLSPTLGVRDQVIVVDNGSTDATARRLARYPWLEVVTNEENRGFALGCNDGAAVARHEVLVFLNNDTILSGRWLDPLIVPFDEDPTVGATGPRSNFVSGPQVAEGASYLRGDMPGMRRFARTWAQDHRGQTSETQRLVGFCLAVRRDVFEQVGGFDSAYGIGGYEDDDLCRRVMASGHRLLITHESFVHHEGHRTFDANGLDWFAEQETNRDRFESRFGSGHSSRDVAKVSACLITKDEESNLATCLASLDGFVDEIVVYDTGSTDSTLAIARSLGATVIEGYWDDDFSRARNAALAQCSGEWIAWLDADETLVCDDIPALRELLDHLDPGLDGLSVPIDNLTGVGVGSGFVHSACRLFRRSRCEWTGRLHEQIAGRGDHRGIQQAPLETARILHTGYLDEMMQTRNKTERNLRVAQAEVAEADGWEKGFSLTSLGRAYLTAGRFEEAFTHCRQGLENSDNPITRRLATRTAAEALTCLGRYDEALEWIGTLREISTSPVQADIAEAKIRLAFGEYEAALDLFERVGVRQFDDDGFEVGRYMYAVPRAQALDGLGRTSDAADVLLEVLVDQGVIDVHLGILVESLRRADRPLDELAAAIPAGKAPNFLAQVLQLPPDTADEVLEACVRQMEDSRVVLATAATLARGLSIERALTWSARMRQAGFTSNCPLLSIATGIGSPELRARAAATVVAAFADSRGRDAFLTAFSDAEPEERETIRAEAAALCPELLAAVTGNNDENTPVTGDGPGPRVSIVLPCRNEAELTLRCLQSLQATTEAAVYEMILVDNGSTDATVTLARVQNPRFRVLRNDDDTGFRSACRQGATVAGAEYLLFLDNRTIMLPGWLGPLIASLDDNPELGAVHINLLYPEGGSDDGPIRGGGLLVRATAFRDVGGFDGVDDVSHDGVADLAFALRAAGWKVQRERTATAVPVEEPGRVPTPQSGGAAPPS
jgi:GT2 family glycosyltransferase/tetratricopeptide (TPR) repeat protein